MNKNDEKKMDRHHEENIVSQKRIYETKGITLIALVITIIVLLVLSGITIAAVGENGLFSRAKEASFKSKMSAYKEQTNLYVSWKIQENLDTDTTGINAGEVLKSAIDQEIVTDITRDDVNIDITEIIEDIKEKDKEFVVVYKGELCYVSSDSISNNAKQVKWCEEIGIKILEYTAPTGIVVKNGKYELVNGIYLCTPKLDQGFNENKTRYLEVGSNGKLTPGNWITDKPTDNWYNYKKQKWANIYVENSGSDIYYVWIPRYCFKLDQDAQRSDVKFIDVDNNYKDENGNLTPWESAEGVQGLKEQGYQVPEAFWFDKNGNGKEDEGEQLAGYWAMKYTAGDEAAPRFSTEVVATSSSIKTKGITGTAVGEGQKYKYYINGEYKGEKTAKTDTFEFSGLSSNTKYTILVEIRESATDKYVGTIVKQISTIDANKPELTGFNSNMTYYVLYDESGNQTIGDKIKNDGSNIPSNWYNYSNSRWANIVVTDGTIKNGKIENATKTTYYTWIPRYEFTITSSQYAQPAAGRTEVRFISGTSKETDTGYKIPEAFWFDKNGNGTEDEGEQLTGYWAMKYTAGE